MFPEKDVRVFSEDLTGDNTFPSVFFGYFIRGRLNIPWRVLF